MSDFEISVIYGGIALILVQLFFVIWTFVTWSDACEALPEAMRRKIDPPWLTCLDFTPIILFLFLPDDRPSGIGLAMISIWGCYIAISTIWAFRINKIRRSLSGELTISQSNDIRSDIKRRFVMTGLYLLIGCHLLVAHLCPT